MEVELKLLLAPPGAEALRRVRDALSLQQDSPMQIGNLSKADRGDAPQPPAAVKATRVAMSKRMSVEQAFQAIAVNCVAHIQANEAGVAQELDVESLHQMRVGLRRLHSALALFKDALQMPDALRQELDWLNSQLDAARDWDVLAGATLPAVADAVPTETGLVELRLAALDQAHEQHQVAALAVASPRYTRLLLRLTRWVQGRGWREANPPPDRKRLTARVTAFARDTLEQRQRRLLKRGGALRGADAEARHQVRIAAKKMRYASEFFASLSAPKKVRRYVAALSRLQDELGWLNDAAVADRLLEQLQDGQAERERSVGFVRGYLAARVNNDDKTIRALWKKFAPMKLPR